MTSLAPNTNPDFVGHKSAVSTLVESFGSGRFHHAWLITGPKGIGKATLAYRFARHVLSTSPNEAAAGLFGDLPAAESDLSMSPENPLFQRIAERAHPDLMTIHRSLNDRGVLRAEISVEDVRPLNNFLSKTPAEGGWRVVVVDAVDEMNVNAANALLKQLEEPPERSLLLLVCHRQGRLLPTIVSRCRRLPMRPLGSEDIAQVFSMCRPETPDTDIPLLTRLAEGSAGRAIELADLGGAAFHGRIRDLLRSLPRLDTAALHALADDASGSGENSSFSIVTTFLLWWVDRLIIHGAGGARGEPTEESEVLDYLARAFPPDHWLQARDRIQDLVMAASGGGNLDRRQVILSSFLALV